MNKKYILKRINAYLIDYIIVSIILSITSGSTLNSTYTNNLLDRVTKLVTDGGTQSQYNEIFTEFASVLFSYYLLVLCVYTIYYVIITSILKGSTLGCKISGLQIRKFDKAPLNHSDLAVRMLFNNGGIINLVFLVAIMIPGIDDSGAFIIFSLAALAYGIFIVSNLVLFFTNSVSLVDRMSKSKPYIIIKDV